MSFSIMQHSENKPGVSGWQASLPPGGNWGNTLGKSPAAEPAWLFLKPNRLVGLSGTAHAGTIPGMAIKIMWSDNVPWSKNFQFHRIKPSTRTEL